MTLRRLIVVTAILSLTTTSQSFSQQQKKVDLKDLGKRRIERPLEKSVLARETGERQKAKPEKILPASLSGSVSTSGEIQATVLARFS